MKTLSKLSILAIAMAAAGCGGGAASMPAVGHAVAIMQATDGNSVSGVVTFEQLDGEVKVTAKVSGLKPNSKHGFHIHQYGRALDAAGKNNGKGAGGHYNPEGHKHGDPDGMEDRHAGDMGNLSADEKGNAMFEQVFDNISISGAKNAILGRGVIIHAKPDSFIQPTGGAGARIACGVIGVAMTPKK